VPLIGPSMTQGAVMRSWRSAARKVSVRQRPYGTLATRRAPRLQRPADVTGIDIRPDYLEYARARGTSEGLSNLDFHQGHIFLN
jgi:hypothetical protein